MNTRPSEPVVYVVVLSWNGWDVLDRCLQSLRRQTYSNRTVVVVDNGSHDGSAEKVRQRYPEAILIENGRNLGFAEGNNIGIRFALDADADYVSLLNQDTEVEPSWLTELVKVAETDRRIGAVGSRMYFHSHQSIINSTGIELNCAGMGWDRGFGRVDQRLFDETVDVLGVTGGAMFLQATAIRRVGAFDPAYFAYYEDLDLSVRLWEAGYRLVYAPSARLRHRFSTSLRNEPSRKSVLILSNRWRFILKHFSFRSFLRHGPAVAAQEARILVGLFRQGQLSRVGLRFRAYVRALAGTAGLLKYRWRRYTEGRQARPWWRFVIPRHEEPDLFRPSLDYRLIEEGESAYTDRVLMGVNDTSLGEGWYPLTKPQTVSPTLGAVPAYRAFGRTAACYLRVAQAGEYRLQLHVSHPFAGVTPPRLRVFCNDEEVGAFRVDTYRGQWRTIHFPVLLTETTAKVRFVAESPLLREQSGISTDLGLWVNEVSILEPDSVFLRTDLGSDSEDRPDCVATSLAPSSLRAGLSLVSAPRRTADAVDLVLSVKNLGDTLWLTPEIAGNRGFVSVGAHLLDLSGKVVRELGPRGLLGRPLYPGEQQEVRLTLRLPKATIQGRLKFDLVNERIAWFEQLGSTPMCVELPSLGVEPKG